MLPQKRRISKNEFPRDARRGVRKEGRYFSAVFFSGTAGTPTRFAIVVSGKVSKKATVRNKIRRRAYAALRNILPKTKEGRLVIFFARPNARDASFEEIVSETEGLMRASGALSDVSGLV